MAQRGSKLSWTLALFFLSGATSLVYEVLWTRRLSLTFGHTVLAVSTVLTVFMSGLALGSFLAGRWTDRERSRLADQEGGAGHFLAIYGRLEIGIGVWAVLTLFLLNGVESVYLSAARGGASNQVLYAIVFLGSFLVLLPPTTAMGATLPIFTQLLVATKQDVGAWLSRIYGWNTLGACVGAGLGGFLLLPALGLKISVVVAALGNLLIGGYAIVSAKRLEDEIEVSLEDFTADSEPESQEGSGALLLPVAFGFSGFAAMIYQLGWTRGLVLSIGSSTYSFAIILTAFLASLGLGSLIYKRVMSDRAPRLMHLAYLQFAIAIFGLLTTTGIGLLPQVMVTVIPALDYNFLKILVFDFVICVALMVLPTLAMGLTFPLVTHLYTDQLSSLGKRLGEAYAANTLGAILGSFTGGFVIIPVLGAQKALLAAVVVNLLVGLILSLRGSGNKVPSAVLCGLGALFLVVSPNWDPTRLSAGAGIYAKADHFFFVPALYQDGISATITVGYNQPNAPYLKVNGKTDASVGSEDMPHQVLLGLVPVSIHKNPKRVALVGLGSGVTTAALAATDSVQDIQCSELEPAIVDVQPYFAPYTEHVLTDPKVTMSVTDGRTFILGSPEKFDVIVSQPSNPWIAGIGNLYTEDFYRSCAERLNEGGLMCQWFHLYSISEYDLHLVLETFFHVYPQGMVCQTGPGDIVLVGGQEAIDFDRERMRELWSEERMNFWCQSIGLLEPGYLLGSFVATREQVLENLAQSGLPKVLNTDDKPILEFQAPRSLYLKTSDVAKFPERFDQLVPQSFAQDPQAKGQALLGRFQLDRRYLLEQRVDKALQEQVPWSPLVAALLTAQAGDMSAAEGLLRGLALENAERPSAQVLLGDLRSRAGQWELAAVHYENALEGLPEQTRYLVLMKLGQAEMELQDYEKAKLHFQAARDLTKRPEPHYFLGHLTYLQTQDAQQSLAYFEQAIQKDPHEFVSLTRAALMKAQLGDLQGAIEYAQRSYQSFRENRLNVEMLAQLKNQVGEHKEAQVYQELANLLKMKEAELNR